MTYFISIIFCCSVWQPKQRANVAPRTFRPSCASSEIPSPPSTLSSGWLLCQIIEQRPPKANAPPYLSLFFDVHCFVAPNKGTGRCDHKPSAGRLHWTYREQQHDDLGAPLPYPWTESKAAGYGSGGFSFWLLCVVCVFVVVFCVWEQLLATIRVESQHWPRQNGRHLQGHRPKFPPKHPKYKWMYKLVIIQRCCTCFDLLVQSSVGHTTNLQKAC